jgi:hypothetical protein
VILRSRRRVRYQAYVANVADTGKAVRAKDFFRKGRDLALQGIVGGAAWWVVGAVAVVVAGFLKGTIPAGPAIIVFLVVLGVSASISTGLMRRADRVEGERDEAQRQAAADRTRALEIENQADIEKRELREQLAAATGGQQVVSTRMQSIARQVEALDSVGPAYSNGPDSGQIGLLVALLEDFDQKHPNDPVVQGLLKEWTGASPATQAGAWQSALKVLKARAVSLGAEESLGQES